ncbi:MAG: hypothetical protein NC254_03555 [bacterium]|nr:hypothetical protein [bacterium]
MSCRKEKFLTIIVRVKENMWVNFVVLFFGILLAYIYGINIPNINTVWELPDEAGYLCNAAFFSGNDWSNIASRLPYYGYGYSLILIPLFFICQSGISIIHGAIFINLLCILISYFLQIVVMSRVCDKCSKNCLPIFAFIISLQPYLITNTLKVLCEVFLSMWVWLIAFVLVKCFECRKLYVYIVLGMVTGYIYTIHIRAIVIVGTVGLILVLLYLKRNISLMQIAVFAGALLATFVLLNLMKKNIVINSMQMMEGDDRENVNVINGNFIIQRLLYFVKDAYSYLIMFMGKILYLITTTCGMIFWGIYGCFEGLKESCKARDEKKFALYFYIGSSIILMLVASTLGSGINPQNFTYIFYGRYYEYALSPIFFLGLYTAAYGKKVRKKYLVLFLFITVFAGVITYSARSNFLEHDQIYIDTARIAGFSTVVCKNSDYKSLIAYTTIICVLMIAVEIGLALRHKLKILIPVLVFIIMMQSSIKCQNKVLEVNEKNIEDCEVIEFMIENNNGQSIIFVDSNYSYFGYYSRAQVLLKDIKLEVIQENEADGISEGMYYLTYLSSDLGKRLEAEGRLIKRGTAYGVYVNR